MEAFLLSLLFLCSIAPTRSEPSITKVVFTLVPASAVPTQVPLWPKTIYVAGSRYARIEQQGEGGTTNLIIVNEPDIWVINGKDKQGIHMVNPGPDFTVHNPILGPNGPDELFYFEYGREARFFDENNAKRIESKEMGGHLFEGRELAMADYRIALYSDPISSPVLIKIFKGDDLQLEIVYQSYQRHIAFDPSLFQPARDIKVKESPPQAH